MSEVCGRLFIDNTTLHLYSPLPVESTGQVRYASRAGRHPRATPPALELPS